MKMAAGKLLMLTAILLVSRCEARVSTIRVPPNYGCAHGRKDGLYHHHDVSACRGTWLGHVSHAELCSAGWHTCSKNDTELLSSVSWYSALHLEGCYAINAAHNGGTCGDCSPQKDEMASIGADCAQQNLDATGCFGQGKIDASWELTGYPACHHAPWISGVVCCRNKLLGSKAEIVESPRATVWVGAGERVTLTCRARGKPLPDVTWFRNGRPADETRGVMTSLTIVDDVTVSTISVEAASAENVGLFRCKAENRHGHEYTYSSDVRINATNDDVKACWSRSKQTLLLGGEMAACEGRWKGSVRRASKQLCAPGWRVCGAARDRKSINRVTWSEAIQLPGCFAYDAATTDNFDCARCSERRKGNVMSGLGNGCGAFDREMTSCLSRGRIDVRSSRPFRQRGGGPLTSASTRRRERTCHYQKRITTGVVCCRRKVNSCTPPCGQNMHCNRKGACKCDAGFKLLDSSGACVPRGHDVISARSPTTSSAVCDDDAARCANGGSCWKGKCFCTEAYTGDRCERVKKRRRRRRNHN